MDTLAQKIATTRIKDTQDQASAETQAAKALEHQRREKRRERNRLLWAEHFERLAASLRSRAEDYEQRASSLLLGEEARCTAEAARGPGARMVPTAGHPRPRPCGEG